MESTPGFLPGDFQGQRSLEGYCPRGCKESASGRDKESGEKKRNGTGGLDQLQDYEPRWSQN